MYKINKKNTGFTLMEIIMVIAVLVIIFVVVMPSINSARKKGTDAAVISSLDNLRTPAYLWFRTVVITDPRFQHFTDCPTTVATVPSTVGLFFDPVFSSGIVQITQKVSQIVCDSTVSTYAIVVVLKGPSAILDQEDVYCTDSEDNKVRSVLYHWVALSGDGAVYAINRLTGLCNPA